MKYEELCEKNYLWENISRMVDELQDNKEIQITLETWDDDRYWIISNFIAKNSVPMITWSCFADGFPEKEDIVCSSWQDLKERIFELVTGDDIVNYYTEDIC